MIKLDAMDKIEDYSKQIYIPPGDSHKGQNGKLLLIGGSKLFHAASLWALNVASRIVDLVHYASIPENNELVKKAKEEFHDGIVIPRSEIENYIKEDDCILIGPGLVRTEEKVPEITYTISNLKEIEEIEHEGLQTYHLTKYLLKKYPDKKWVIDAGALQMLELDWIPKGAILTPHHKEFAGLELRIKNYDLRIKMKDLELKEKVKLFAKEYHCVVILKGEQDIVCSENKCEIIKGGNSGMTKGGTGDVLAGLIAALNCKNDPFVSTVIASYVNKKAGENLFGKVGYYYNASDLALEIPKVLKSLVNL